MFFESIINMYLLKVLKNIYEIGIIYCMQLYILLFKYNYIMTGSFVGKICLVLELKLCSQEFPGTKFAQVHLEKKVVYNT